MLIGGFAVIAHGGARTTKDIDLLIDANPTNVACARGASPSTLIRTKNTIRPSDAADRHFLQVLVDDSMR